MNKTNGTHPRQLKHLDLLQELHKRNDKKTYRETPPKYISTRFPPADRDKLGSPPGLSLTRRAYIAFAPQSCDRDRGFGIATFDSSLTSWLTTTRTGLLLTCFMREGIDEVCWVRGVPTEPMTCHVKQKMDSERYDSRAEVSRASHSSWAPRMITILSY